MSDDRGRILILQGPARILAYGAAGFFALVLLLFVALQVYLSTPLPARQLSRLVTAQLAQEFTVKSVSLHGGAVLLEGVRLHGPKGFPGPDLFAAGAVRVRPRWLEILRGHRRFDLVAVDGGGVNLQKDAAGTWNFADLQRHLAARKPAAAPETVIGTLLIRNGSLTVQGEGVKGVNVTLHNLSSGGSLSAQVDLVFRDAAGNPYRLRGTARPGNEAALDLTLNAPNLALQKAAELFGVKNSQPLSRAHGSLVVNAVLVKGELRSSGSVGFRDVLLPAARGSYPIAGTLRFNGSYDTRQDRADLEEATLDIENVAQLHAEGSVAGVRKERGFVLLFGVDGFDLALLNVLLTEQARRGLLFEGKVRCESLRLEGSGARGVESAAGLVLLDGGTLAGKSGAIVAELSGRAKLSRAGGGIAAVGRLVSEGGAGKATVVALDLPFDLTLSSKLRPVRVAISGGRGRVMGLPLAGELSYDLTRPEPLAAALKVPETALSSLNPFLKRYDLQADAGVASATLDVHGKGGSELSARVRLHLAGVSGKRGSIALRVREGTVTAEGSRLQGHLQAAGDVRLSGLALGDRPGDLRFGCRVDGERVTVEGVQARLGDVRLAVARLSGTLPPGERAGGGRKPLAWELEGGTLRQGNFELSGLSGSFRGAVVGAGSERWLEGEALLAAKSAAMREKRLGAPVVRASFSKDGGRAELGGRLLGGELAGEASFRVPAPRAAAFRASLVGAAAAQAAAFLPATAMRPTGGTLDLRTAGSYAEKEGLACRFEVKGRTLSMAKGGRNALSGGALFASGSYGTGKLSIGEGLLSPGKGVVLRVRGEIDRVASPQRQGTLSFSLPDTPLEAVVDAAINLLPQPLQEATVKGTVSANGKLEFRQGRQLLSGGIGVRGGNLEAAPQKLAVSGVNGTIPISLDLSGRSPAQPQASRDFSRANYRRLLDQLRSLPAGGELLSVDRVSFGTLGLDKLTLRLRAANGLMEVAPLRTSLYQGTLLGTGYLAMRERPAFRTDLLVNGLSLKQLCRTIPGFQGYISGRVDGIVSVRGMGGGIGGMTGFADLWAREGEGEKMLVSKEFLQRLAKQKLSGFFFRTDRPYDEAEIKATLQEGDLTFNTLKIVHTNLFGVKDLNVNIAPTQNRIALDHLLESIREAAVRGRPAAGEAQPKKEAPRPEAAPEFKWEE